MNNQTTCTFLFKIRIRMLRSRHSTQKYGQSELCLRPKTQGPSILRPWFLMFSWSASLSSERGALSPFSILPRLYFCRPANLASSIRMGFSVVPTIFPCRWWKTMDLHTSRHMLNQSVTVLADFRVVTVDHLCPTHGPRVSCGPV